MTEPHGDTPQATAPDYDLRRGEEPLDLGPPRRRPVALWAGAIVLVLGAVAVWVFGLRQSPAPVEAPVATDAPASADPAPTPLGAAALDREIPPLEQSDVVVRELVRQLSSHPTLAAWLATDGLIRSFAAAVANVGSGQNPERQLSALRPASGFAVLPQGDGFVIDPASYRRYDPVAAAATSIAPDGAARLYGTLKPRIEEAYREMGEGDVPVDRAIERAIVLLLRTPVVDGPVRLETSPRGVGYVFADPRLEALTPAQKQLLRMGPANVRAIQRSLRDIALALGIPAARLPQASDRTAGA